LLSKNYYDIRESTGFKNVSLAVSEALQMIYQFDFLSRISLRRKPRVRVKGPKKFSSDSYWNPYVDEELTFIHPDDVKLYNEWDSRAFELQVANHELLGHGSGKLFEEYADGTKNFDPEKVSKTDICIRSMTDI